MKKSRTRRSLRIFLFLLWAVPPAAGLAVYDENTDTQKEVSLFESRSGAKLSHGLTNLVWGWSEIVRTPQNMVRDGSSLGASLAQGIPLGFARAFDRTLRGIYQTATFYVPPEPPVDV